MFFKKDGYPEEGELVFCTVTNVQYNSVFARIEEYRGKSGLIHISEISPGRIRNIRDYVKEGKMVVCKILRVDQGKGHIDLSLRRVNERERKQKIDERKQEQKAEKIIEALSVQVKKPAEKVYNDIASVLLPKYELLQNAFEDVVENNASLEEARVPKEYSGILESLVREKIKPKQVVIRGNIMIKTYAENGVELVRNSLSSAKQTGSNIDIKYLGAGQYSIEVNAKEYKEAEKSLKSALSAVESSLKKDKNSSFLFKKKERD